MAHRRLLAMAGAAVAVASIAVVGTGATPVLAQRNLSVQAVLQHQPLKHLNGKALPQISGGTQQAIRDKTQDVNRGEEADASSNVGGGDQSSTLGCRRGGSGGNVRVNQDCTFRRQAEEQIAVDPTNPQHIIAGQNDSRIGWNHCGYDYSFDGGNHWGDGIPPFYQHLNQGVFNDADPNGASFGGTFHTYDAASDPAVTFDSQGNAFYSCVVFDIADAASGIFVTDSLGSGSGSSYANVGTGYTNVVTENNDPAIFNDKEFIAADSHSASPYADNVYITWSRFDCNNNGCISPIYFSRSTDHAHTWSAPVEISGNSPSLCFSGDFGGLGGQANDCNFDQGSSPVVRPDGTIYVAYNNGNTPAGDPNGQQLLVMSHDGGQTWSAPVKLGDDMLFSSIDGSQFPTCDFGRGPEECVPAPTDVRTNDFPALAIDGSGNQLAAVWQDFRNGTSSNENYDIVMAYSTDGGSTWHTRMVYADAAHTAQFEPAVSFNQKTGAVAVSYYDRSVNNDASSGRYDYSGSLASSVTAPLSHRRLSSVSALSPDNNPSQAGFLGDYSSVAWSGKDAVAIWSDGRNLDPNGFPDEDVFVARFH